MITPEQIRIARAYLDWSTADLSNITGIATSTINKIERKQVNPHKQSLLAIQTSFELCGIEFLSSDGLRLRESFVEIWEGTEVFQRLLDDIFYEMRDKGGEVRTYGITGTNSTTTISKDKLKEHIGRLAEYKIKERVLVKEGEKDFVNTPETYHQISEKYFSYNPICIYGSKVALVIREAKKVIIINDPRMAESVGKLFDFAWDHTNPLTLNERGYS